MKNIYCFVCIFFCFLVTIHGNHAEVPKKPGCLEKQNSIALLVAAESLLSKARDSFPSFEEDVNSTDQANCEKKMSLAYIETSKKLISEARKNFQTCTKPDDDKYRNCFEVFASGQNKSGVYTIWPKEPLIPAKPLQVYCDMDTDKGGWTVIQRRGKFKVQQDFYRDWETYRNGFGNLSEEFWLGNENIRVLCLRGCEIRFDLQDEKGERGFAHYESFYLSISNYRLSISGYSGNINDEMKHGNNKEFATKDKGDTVRAMQHQGGWWYGYPGFFCNLNGIFQPGVSNEKSVAWHDWRKYENLASVEMKVRPN